MTRIVGRRTFGRHRVVLLVALLGLAALNVGAAVVPMRSASDARESAHSAKLNPRMQRFTMEPLQSYDVISARPLFTVTRRPPPQIQEQPPQPPPIPEAQRITVVPVASPPVVFPSITLVGVMLSRDERIALLKAPSAGKTLRLRERQVFEGWRLEEIHTKSVVFMSGDTRRELFLLPPRSAARRLDRGSGGAGSTSISDRTESGGEP